LGVLLPEVLSFREFRQALAATLKRVQEPGAGPVFVGAHRKPEAVVMSVSRYEELVAAAERRADVAEALASVRAEGLEPGPEGLTLLEEVAAGRMSTEQARERVLARYRG
jgi:PHD/YefM family antitoxin component YafN of YafNO toxin-antitoxin module